MNTIVSVPDMVARAQSCDFLLLGEVHGSKQNAPLVQAIAEELSKLNTSCTLAFEWNLSSEESRSLQAYLEGSDRMDKIPKFFLDSDGRFTFEHANLLEWIRSLYIQGNTGISVVVFDEGGVSWSTREEGMTRKLLTHRAESKGPFIVETGSIHARKKVFSISGEEMQPLGYRLEIQSSVFSVYLQYTSGSVAREGDVVPVKEFSSVQEGPKDYFDAMYHMPESEPAVAPTLTDLRFISTM